MKKVILIFLIIIGNESFSQKIVPKIIKPFSELNKKVDFERIINNTELNLKVDQLSQKLNIENRAVIRIVSFFRIDNNNNVNIGKIVTKPKGYESIARKIIIGFSEDELKLMSKKDPIHVLTKIELGNYKKRIKKRLKNQ
ncbi:hypothetical protein [Ochrovirga pacifica]|uniref:hypothetical protein n=1 Tax=Ochrovirga pacifica TaxID=1042376 RepID=UPI0002557FEB|nr:hypothetical protein [Ochrovirga pacifica]